jgi:hypothetical protein
MIFLSQGLREIGSDLGSELGPQKLPMRIQR